MNSSLFQKNQFQTLACLIILLFGRCSSDAPQDLGPDTEVPVIKIIETEPAAKAGLICGFKEDKVISATSGSMMLLHLNLTDDRNLSQYKIDIHNNFDCHSHGRVLATPWQVLEVNDVNGNNIEIEKEIQVPAETAAGDYHLQILCLDESGNEAEPVIYSIKILNATDSVAPELTLTEPSTHPITVDKGATLSFKGTVTDNYSLNDGKIEVTYTDPKGTEYAPIQEFFAADQGTGASFDYAFEVPAFAASGKHIFSIKVFDSYNNFSEQKVDVTFQ